MRNASTTTQSSSNEALEPTAAQDTLALAQKELKEWIGQNPLTSLALAAGFGICLGWLLKSRP